ncbi:MULTISPECIES: ankyrin repeat domain-containing protein [Candidatus Cardinium]|uniref:ankyrin repeat domain-containing protein n=1 Tax=Candidatus Cardinium TaxID=273135 RepID=UPI001FAA542B|nr:MULTISPECIES: ankyrin repeat domain-containing protein [Cardinium]
MAIRFILPVEWPCLKSAASLVLIVRLFCTIACTKYTSNSRDYMDGENDEENNLLVGVNAEETRKRSEQKKKKLSKKREKKCQIAAEQERLFIEVYEKGDITALRDYFNFFRNSNMLLASKEKAKLETYLTLIIASLLTKEAQTTIRAASDVARIRELLDHPLCDVNKKDKYCNAPIHAAVFHSNIILLKMLLKKADINVNLLDASGLAPIHRAIMHNDEGVFRMLLEREDIDPNLLGRGLPPMYRAIQIHRMNLLTILLTQKQKKLEFDIRAIRSIGATNAKYEVPLIHYLVHWYHPQIWEMFMEGPEDLKVKIDVNAKDSYGCTALHCALYHVGKSEVGKPEEWPIEGINKLLEHNNIDVNACVNTLYTPLHTLIFNKNFNESLCLKLINHERLNVDHNPAVGITPYAFAWLVGNKEAMKILSEDQRFSTNTPPIHIKWYYWLHKIIQLNKSEPDDLATFSALFEKVHKKLIEYENDKKAN